MLPGQCWAIKGHRGKAVIKLFAEIQITGFSLEHILPSVAPTEETSSAPKDFTIKVSKKKITTKK